MRARLERGVSEETMLNAEGHRILSWTQLTAPPHIPLNFRCNSSTRNSYCNFLKAMGQKRSNVERSHDPYVVAGSKEIKVGIAVEAFRQLGESE